MNNYINSRVSADVLKKSIISDDISKVYDALAYLNDNVRNETDDKVLYEWAQIITSVNLNNSADLQLLYAEVFYHLYNWKKKKSLPDWRGWKAAKVVEVSWRQLEIYLETEKIDFSKADETTLQALFDLDTPKVCHPEAFFEKICDTTDIRIQSIALKLIRQGLESSTILSHQAYKYLINLCKESNILIIKDALEMLSEAWAQGEEFPLELVEKALCTDSIQVKMSAIKALEAWQNFDKLEVILKDETQDQQIRCMAMKALGKSQKKDLVGYILSISADDSLGLGEACFSALEQFHHMGIFIKEEQLDDLINIFVQNIRCGPEIFEMLTFTCREQLVAKIGSMEEIFEIWIRLSTVIPMIQTTSIKDVVINFINKTKVMSVKGILLRLIGDIGGIDEEELVLSYLEDYTQECLFALKHIGSTKTVDVLWNALGVWSSKPFTQYYLLPYQKEALTLLWHLCEDEKRNLLKSKLNPTILPVGIIKDLVPTLDEEDMRLLLFKKDELSVEDVISTLCQYGNAETIGEITELFFRHVSELAVNKQPKEIYNLEYAWEPTDMYSIIKSIKKFGEHLFNRGKIRPAYLLKALNAKEAAEVLLSEIIFNILDNKEPTINEIRILLEVLENLKHYTITYRMRKLIRNKAPQVRKMVVRCFVKQHAVGHTFDILRLLEAGDIETRRQAIIAMEEFNAVWASSYVTKCLEHPNMNIKKASAKALIKIGDYKCIKRLIFWLGYHDNPEFRQLLLDALRSVAGPSFLSHLLKELESSTEERKSRLILETFDCNINMEVVKNLLRNKYNCSDLVLNALIDGDIRLSNGSVLDLFNLQNKLYKASIEKLIYRDSTKTKDSDSDSLISSHKLSDKDEFLNLLKLNKLSEAQTEFLILNYLREWLKVIDGFEHISKESLEKFLLVAEKSFVDSHYEVLAGNVFILLKMLDSNSLSYDMEEKYFKMLYRVLTLLKKPIALKAANTIRNDDFIKSRGNYWAYKLLKLCHCILLDTDIYNAIFKLDNSTDKINLLKDAYQLQDLNLGKFDKSADEFMKNNDLENLKYNEKVKWLIQSISKSNANDTEENFAMLNELIDLNIPAWIVRKDEESNKDIEIKKISVNKENSNNSIEYERYLIELLNNPELKIRQEAATEILKSEMSTHACQKVLLSYLEGKIKRIEEYKSLMIQSMSLFPKEWYMEQIKTQSRDWIFRLIELTAKMGSSERRCHISWLYALWQSEDELISTKALDCLRGLETGLLVCESINYHRFNQSLGVNKLDGCEDYEEIVSRLDRLGLKLGLHSNLLLSEEDLDQLKTDYKELHNPVERVNIEAKNNQNRLADLIDDAQSNDITIILNALKQMTKFKENTAIDVAAKLLEHKNSRVRSASHRCLRQIADKEDYLKLTYKLLYDARIDVQRSAIRTLSFAKYEPAIPAIIDLFGSKNSKLQEYAADGLKTFGSCVIPLLKKAEKKARPDQQQRYREIIELI